MVLSDRTIREQIAAGRLVIDPFDDSLVQPSSIDLRVSHEFRVFHNNRQPYIDPREPEADLTELVRVNDGEPFILHPGEFVLGSTLERVGIPDDLVARLEGKSKLSQNREARDVEGAAQTLRARGQIALADAMAILKP